MTPTLSRIAAVIFFSGFCSLVYQVAWLRLLRLIFGASTASTAVVLAIFMGGLGLGGWWLGRRVERSPNALAFYAGLEIGIAVTAAASPLLIAAVKALYVGLGGAGTLGLAGATALRLVLSVLVLGVPTTLMGGTLPAVARAVERASDRGRRLVAVLYGVNTLGAVAGACLTTFVLLEFLGVRQSLWLAAALNLLLAMIVRGMARQAASLATAEEAETAAEKTAAETPAASAPRAPEALPSDLDASPAATRIVLVAAGVVGFIFFLMELVWYRMLAPVLGGSSYTFGLILTVALAGIGAGGALYGLGSESRRPTLAALAWTCLLEALWLAVPYALGDDLALSAAVLRDLQTLGFAALAAGWALVTVIVVLPAAVISGYQFPLLVALLGSGRRHVASQVGLAYAWNTWGAIAGSLAGGFALLPLLSAPRLWRLSVLLLVVLGLALAVLAWRRERRWARALATVAVALAALGLCRATGPSAFWRHTPIGAGRVEIEARDPNELRNLRHRYRRSLVREAEGVESSVALMQVNELSLFVNGKSDSAARGDGPTTVMSGLVGALLHGAPRRALVIGLGTGATVGWLAEVAGMERVDVIELEPAVGELAAAFAAINFDVLDHPKVRLIYGDGREYVLTTGETYDLIFSEPSNPYRAGVADLFSQDFYRSVRARLRPGGVFGQWLQLYEVDADVIRIAFSTLASVFPHVESWQVHVTDLLLLGTSEGLEHDFGRIRARLGEEPFATAMKRLWGVDATLEGFYSGFVAGPAFVRQLERESGFRVSSDDQPLIEFGCARNVGRKDLLEVRDLHRLARLLGADRPRAAGEPPDWARVEEARQLRDTLETFSALPPPDGTGAAAARRAARQAYRDGDLAAAAAAWSAQDEQPVWPADRFLVAEALADGGAAEAGERIAELAAEAPTEAAFIAARLSLRQGDAAAAAGHLEAAFTALRSDPWVFLPVARRGFQLLSEVAAADRRQARRLLEALEEPFAVLLFEEGRLVTRVNLAARVDFLGECVAAFAALEPHVIWEEDFLAARRRCYEGNDHPLAARAARELADYRKHAPAALKL